MTPVGHVAVSLISLSKLRISEKCCAVFAAIAPDLDLIFVALDGDAGAHRTATHSLLFVSIVALLMFTLALCNKKLRAGYILIACIFGGGAHIIVDSCLDNNPDNGLGVSFFWPFLSNQYQLFPVSQLLGLENGSWDAPVAMVMNGWPILLLEILLAIYALRLYAKKRSDSLPVKY